VQRLTVGEVLREVVLVHLELAALPADHERTRVLRDAGAVDRVDDLKRLLHDDSRGDVQKGAARPERRVPGLQLVPVDRQALRIPALDQLFVIAECILQRTEDHAALGQLVVELDLDDLIAALHEPAGVRPVGERA
jgi:hypothetical protein